MIQSILELFAPGGISSRKSVQNRAHAGTDNASSSVCHTQSDHGCLQSTTSARARRAAPATTRLDARIRRFAPVEIAPSVEPLPRNEREALAQLVKAAMLMDGLFLEQVWAGNPSLLTHLAADRTPEGQAELHYFLINKGPWSRLDHNEPFLRLATCRAKPPQANFYPADATKEEVEKWFGTLKGDAHAAAVGFFTVIRRGADRRLIAVPYSFEYQNALVTAAGYLREAAKLTTQPTLKKYLELRADAFLSNDYYASDIAWMELDASIEPTIGPYETYEDEWFGYKAAFEAFVTLRDDAETKKLGGVQLRAAGARGRVADRSEIPQPEAGRTCTHSGRQRGVQRRRRQSRRPDRRLQPAERRPRHQGEGLEARDAEERAGGEVRERADADRGRRAPCRPIARRCRSTRSSRTS